MKKKIRMKCLAVELALMTQIPPNRLNALSVLQAVVNAKKSNNSPF